MDCMFALGTNRSRTPSGIGSVIEGVIQRGAARAAALSTEGGRLERVGHARVRLPRQGRRDRRREQRALPAGTSLQDSRHQAHEFILRIALSGTRNVNLTMKELR
jgi:hypothetical protein